MNHQPGYTTPEAPTSTGQPQPTGQDWQIGPGQPLWPTGPDQGGTPGRQSAWTGPQPGSAAPAQAPAAPNRHHRPADPGNADFFTSQAPTPAGGAAASSATGFNSPPQQPNMAATPVDEQTAAVGFDQIDPFSTMGQSSSDGGEFIRGQQRQHLTGWRRAVRALTFGTITPSPSAKQQHTTELVDRIRGQLSGVAVIAFVNAKGGVGKTTTTVSTGNVIASHRGDRVIAVDIDTDLGNLSARFREQRSPHATVESLTAMTDASSYSNVRAFTVQNEDRLEMLSSQNDPRSSYQFSISAFERAMSILRLHYNVILLDCGTSITSPLFTAVANQVDCLVVVASTDTPGLNGAWRTLGWLQAHGFSRLLPKTVLALNATSSDRPALDIDDAATKFRDQVQQIIKLPYDKHLHEGESISLKSMTKKGQKAALELAGAIATHYPRRSAEAF